MRIFFRRRNFIVTALVLATLWVMRGVGIQIEMLNVFEQVFENFELTDIYYNKLRNPAAEPFEKEVVLVNIGDLDRRGIAQQIRILSKYKPKVIGMDVMFAEPRPQDPVGDFQLMQAVRKAGNVVLGSQPMEMGDGQVFDTLLRPFELLLPHVKTGHVYAGQEYDDFITWRDICPQVRIKGGVTEDALPLAVMRLYDEAKAQVMMDRGNEREVIYFKGNLEKYTKLDVNDVLKENFAPDLIEGKIVLMGYMGGQYTNYFFAEDKFYTPLNKDIIGRGYPDMYGVVVHANILSMMLNKQYVRQVSLFWTVLIAVVVCFLNVSLFAALLEHPEWAVWYNPLTKTLQFAEAVLVLFVSVYAFVWWQLSLSLGLTFFVVLLSGDVTEIAIDVGWRVARGVAHRRGGHQEQVGEEVPAQEI